MTLEDSGLLRDGEHVVDETRWRRRMAVSAGAGLDLNVFNGVLD